MQNLPPACRDAVHAWEQAGWPLTGRRADADAGSDEVCVGLALPPCADTGAKNRVPLRVNKADVIKVLPALDLQDVAAAVPPHWRAPFEAFAMDAAASQLSFKVFGSLALQAITNQPYLTPTSDIDVLFYPASREQLQHALALLQKHAACLPIDGEIVFPSGAAVAWKEWCNALQATSQPRVLVKGMQSVQLAAIETLLSTLGDEPCPISHKAYAASTTSA